MEIEFDVPIDLWEQAKRGELVREAAQLQAFCKLMVDRAIEKADADAEKRAQATLEAAAQRDADRRAANAQREPGDQVHEFDEVGDDDRGADRSYRAPDPAPQREPERPREPERRPTRTEYDDRRDNQGRPERHYADTSRPEREPERRGRWGGGDQRQQGGGQNESWLDTKRTPTKASQLFGYTKDLNATSWFTEWGKDHGLSWEFKSWPNDAVCDAVDDFLRAGRPQDAQRNGSSNGYAGAGRGR